jgi:hypothetical protein
MKPFLSQAYSPILKSAEVDDYRIPKDAAVG